MQQPPAPPTRASNVPSFYLTRRQPVRPAVLLLAAACAAGVLCLFGYGTGQLRRGHRNTAGDARTGGTAGASAADAGKDDDDDDPNQIDTIVLGDPADAPVPARHGNHVSPVHPTIVVRLPRYGDQTGLIPDSPAGHLLYGWLAAFNHASGSELAEALPSVAGDDATAAQLALRRKTGGFSLLSAKEVLPGVLVFRLRDQTTPGVEALGTLQMRPESNPPAIASFSLRAVDRPPPAEPGTPPKQ